MKKIVLGVLAHVDSGKTTLSEALLYLSGSIKKPGRVDRGDSFFDSFALERSRGITIFSKEAVIKSGGAQLTLLDTPGHADLGAEAERTLQVLDYAVLVVSAPAGVQSHTVTLWRLLAKYGVPCFVFINKTDLCEDAGSRALQSLRDNFGEGFTDFSKEGGDGFYEELALSGEELMEEYFQSGKIGVESIARAVKERRVFPCLFGSALKLEGVDALLQALEKYTVEPEYGDEFAARVFKITEDRGLRLTHMKITGGCLKVKDIIKSAKNTSDEKADQIRIYNGEKYNAVSSADAGSICAVSGISFAGAGDGLGAEAGEIRPLLSPVFTYGIELPDGIDAHTALQKLKRLEDEDPLLKIEWNSRAGQIQAQLMGDIQLEILKELIRERFGFEAKFTSGSVIYKETIANAVEGVGHFEPLRHYAEVHLILKPGKRGSGLVFKNECRDDTLDKNWQRLIMTHLGEKAHIGVLTGSPVTDIEITLASAKAHPKHTEGGDFRQATYRAVRQGLRKAQSVLLEPMYDFTLELPAECVGRAISDIQRMNGSFFPPESSGAGAVITGRAPVLEMRDYAREVIRYTRGNGRLRCAPGGYEPCRNAQEVIAAAGYDCDADTDNTCDSVFCSHGAGYVVKWNEVESHMHLQSALSKPKSEYRQALRSTAAGSGKSDLFALDRELMKIFEQTYGPIKSRQSPPDSAHFTFTQKKSESEKGRRQSAYGGAEYLLVDGYNVIFAWDRLREVGREDIDAARTMLTNILCNYRGFKKCEVILVFDAYRVKGAVREVEKTDGITTVYTKEAETADAYIEKASYRLAKENRVRVVTSDAAEQLIILGNGALRVSSREFEEEVQSAEEEIRRIISEEQ